MECKLFYITSKLETIHHYSTMHPYPPLPPPLILLQIIVLLKKWNKCSGNYERFVVGAIYCVLTILRIFTYTLWRSFDIASNFHPQNTLQALIALSKSEHKNSSCSSVSGFFWVCFCVLVCVDFEDREA